jgi:hypothetical protein
MTFILYKYINKLTEFKKEKKKIVSDMVKKTKKHKAKKSNSYIFYHFTSLFSKKNKMNLCVLDCVYVYKMIGDFLIGKLEKLDIITK